MKKECSECCIKEPGALSSRVKIGIARSVTCCKYMTLKDNLKLVRIVLLLAGTSYNYALQLNSNDFILFKFLC